MKLTVSAAILCGSIAVAAAVYRLPAPHQERYQLAPFGPGVVARLDIATGAIDLCGSIEAALPLMQRASPSTDQMIKLENEIARDSKCVELTYGIQ